MMVDLSGNFAQYGAAGDDVFDGLFGAGVVEPAFVFEPGDGVLDFGAGFEAAEADTWPGRVIHGGVRVVRVFRPAPALVQILFYDRF